MLPAGLSGTHPPLESVTRPPGGARWPGRWLVSVSSAGSDGDAIAVPDGTVCAGALGPGRTLAIAGGTVGAPAPCAAAPAGRAVFVGWTRGWVGAGPHPTGWEPLELAKEMQRLRPAPSGPGPTPGRAQGPAVEPQPGTLQKPLRGAPACAVEGGLPVTGRQDHRLRGQGRANGAPGPALARADVASLSWRGQRPSPGTPVSPGGPQSPSCLHRLHHSCLSPPTSTTMGGHRAGGGEAPGNPGPMGVQSLCPRLSGPLWEQLPCQGGAPCLDAGHPTATLGRGRGGGRGSGVFTGRAAAMLLQVAAGAGAAGLRPLRGHESATE